MNPQERVVWLVKQSLRLRKKGRTSDADNYSAQAKRLVMQRNLDRLLLLPLQRKGAKYVEEAD